MTDTKKPGPVEVWLTKKNIEVTCRVVHEDETVTELDINSLSMRGAQREITGYYKRIGYDPAGRWEQEPLGEDVPEDAEESYRLFRPVPGWHDAQEEKYRKLMGQP